MNDRKIFAKGRRAISVALLALAPLMMLVVVQTFSRQFSRDIRHGRVDTQIVGPSRPR